MRSGPCRLELAEVGVDQSRWQGLLVRACEGEREDEVVPASDEREQPGCDEAGEADREQNAVDDRPLAGAVHLGRLDQLVRNGIEEPLEHPDAQRQRERGERQDQREVRVEQAVGAEDQVERDEQQRLREHLRGQDQVHQRPSAAVAELREGVRGVGRDDDGKQRGRHGHDDAVHQVAQQGRVLGEVGEVFEGDLPWPQPRGERERVGVGRQRGDQQPVHRAEREDADQRHGDGGGERAWTPWPAGRHPGRAVVLRGDRAGRGGDRHRFSPRSDTHTYPTTRIDSSTIHSAPSAPARPRSKPLNAVS